MVLIAFREVKVRSFVSEMRHVRVTFNLLKFRSCIRTLKLATPSADAARAPVPAQTRPGLLKYRMRYRRAASKTPFEAASKTPFEYLLSYRSRSYSRNSSAAVSWSSSAPRDRTPLQHAHSWFVTGFQYILKLVRFFSINIDSAIYLSYPE